MGEVRTDLTDLMKERLASIPDVYKEKGDPNDKMRLVDSWKPASKQERAVLLDLCRKHFPDFKTKGALYKAARYEILGIFTTKVIGQTVGNWKKREAQKKESAAEGKHPCEFYFCYSNLTSF